MDILTYSYQTSSNKLLKVADAASVDKYGFKNGENTLLEYTYDAGNKLTKVEDIASLEGFKNGANTPIEYTYDPNGNMLTDANKGITNILYDHLNLPTQVFINNPEHIGNISYIYDAVGTKLKKVVTDASSLISTEYAGNYSFSTPPKATLSRKAQVGSTFSNTKTI